VRLWLEFLKSQQLQQCYPDKHWTIYAWLFVMQVLALVLTAYMRCCVLHMPRRFACCDTCRATVRELSSTSDTSAQLGKLHAELDHVRAKEGLARSALNRSELERLELERQARLLKQQVASLAVQLSVAQDHGRWAWACYVICFS
jgi:hypothetical protein